MKDNVLFPLFFSLVLSGCVYSSHTTKLDSPISKPVVKAQTGSELKSELNDLVEFASIGDQLFTVRRYKRTTHTKEYIPFRAPTKLSFPADASWSATYSFKNDDSVNEYLVYTTPLYYKGEIGVILNDDYEIATTEPVVQLVGAKEGRRWKLNGTGKFFRMSSSESTQNIETPWGVRFGGVNEGLYIFEIINKENSTVTDVIQTIKVTQNDFLQGFVLRGIYIKGKEPYKAGIIKFTAKDVYLDSES